jgi:DNA excision repair protein ERCC-2
MTFDLDQRTAALGVGEFAAFAVGPRDGGSRGGGGVWRAQLGTHWHQQLRTRATAEHAEAAEFEIPLDGRIVHRGWTLSLTGRIDQLVRTPGALLLREIKSVTQALPADEGELRRDYPEYFIQLATYGALARLGLSSVATRLAPGATLRTELVFVETDAGLVQTLTLGPSDEALFRAQLDRVVDFLELRLRARTRLRGLQFRPAFATPRPGQESTLTDLNAVFSQHPLVFFEAPTGFGKTGVLLEFALGQLRSGHFDRALYLTSKATGQLQVVRTLGAMTAPTPDPSNLIGYSSLRSREEVCNLIGYSGATTPVAAWHVRNKAEHCINVQFHCTRDTCAYLAEAAERWPQSGLGRFYLDERHARDLDTLRAAGREARICPYEITRAALAFNDVWIGDYNYVFAPRNRGLFFDQPGFAAARTLLLIDEAHNLPARVADAHSHMFTAAEALAVRDELHRTHVPAPLEQAWDHWCHFLHHLHRCDSLAGSDEDDVRHLLAEIAKRVSTTPLDYAALGPRASDALWAVPSLVDELATSELPRLWWVPRDGELLLTCLDAAPAIGATLREFGGVVLASATLTPVDGFATACGLDDIDYQKPETAARKREAVEQPTLGLPDKFGVLTKRDTRKLYRQLTSGAELLRVEEERDAAAPYVLRALTPWRDGAYDIAVDVRVDTTFQHRSHHYTTTAGTVAALHTTAQRMLADSPAASNSVATGSVAVFFPSYAYAEAIAREMADVAPTVRVSVQPKLRDLARQSAWVDETLLLGDALFLVLGSSFAESIDALGGRVSHAMVVGPALPEVNAVQRARLEEAARAGLSREAAFRRVYQVPGMTKVNQALGRLVRAPGQRAKVLLHCRRFLEPSYANLLAPEYRQGTTLRTDEELAVWLDQRVARCG